ncbi:DUF1330 domain-containing protein [Algicella marina]|nr:DUF1330 domain-containing protein [Algicella marina]
MSAFLIATVTIRDKEKFEAYSKKVGPELPGFGGELLIRGSFAESLHGGGDHQLAAVLRFPDMASLRGWYDSPAYQQAIGLRNAGADMTITAYEAID